MYKLIILSFLFITSCNEITAHFTQTHTKIIPERTPQQNVFSLADLPDNFLQFKFHGKKIIQEKNISEEAINGIYLKNIQLKIKPESKGQTWSFLDSIAIYIQAPNKGPIQIASINNLARTSENILNAIVITDNLKPYFLSDSVILFAKLKGVLPDRETQFEMISTLEAKADAIAACQAQISS